MRTFIVRLSRPFATFELNNLAANRIDIVARCVNAAFWVDGAIRRDVEIWFCFADGRSVRLDGSIRSMNPDERCIAGFFRGLLEGKTYDGITCLALSFEEVLGRYDKSRVWYMDKDGKDMDGADMGAGSVFVLGDDTGMKVPSGANRVSLGPRLYLTSHCIVVLNNWMDRNEPR